MSRLLAATLIAALSSTAFAERAFAPPTGGFAVPPPEVAPSNDEPRVLDRATVRAALVRARRSNLAAFRAYQRAGVFPSNTYQPGKLNVWRDEGGHFCAAATIIRMSGQTELVERVAEQNNFIRLADVRQGPLMDWILTSGFTQEEIAAIQEPFMPVVRPTMPEQPDHRVAIDARLRKAEDARLLARYRQVDAMLARNQRASLELAVDRLMKHQQLAWTLIDG